MTVHNGTILVHLASGIGNVVLATPLLVALSEMGFTVNVLLDADYSQTADLLSDWSIVNKIFGSSSTAEAMRNYDRVIPAVPPFYWPRFARLYRDRRMAMSRPPDALFYTNEQEYYLAFARTLGYAKGKRPVYRLPIAPSDRYPVTAETLVIAPGCKTGEMAAKRWPYFVDLAERFEDVAVVGVRDDVRSSDRRPMEFPPHAKQMIDNLGLRQTAEVLASAGAVVGNDSGLSHIAAAVGVPTLMIFGPTPHRTLGELPPNVTVLRAGLDCEPCWFTRRLAACASRIDCLRQVTVDAVESEIRRLLEPEMLITGRVSRDPCPSP